MSSLVPRKGSEDRQAQKLCRSVGDAIRPTNSTAGGTRRRARSTACIKWARRIRFKMTRQYSPSPSSTCTLPACRCNSRRSCMYWHRPNAFAKSNKAIHMMLTELRFAKTVPLFMSKAIHIHNYSNSAVHLEYCPVDLDTRTHLACPIFVRW